LLALVESARRRAPAALVEAERKVQEGMERRERIGARLKLEPGADPERAERETEPGALQELLDARADLPLQLPRIGTLEPDGGVRDREHAVQVDEDRDQAFVALAVPEDAPEEARLPVLPRPVQPDVMPADRCGQQLSRLVVPVDDIVG